MNKTKGKKCSTTKTAEVSEFHEVKSKVDYLPDAYNKIIMRLKYLIKYIYRLKKLQTALCHQ